MGIAINAKYGNYGKVVANAVAITKNLEPTVPDDTAAYTFSIQEGDNDVTNPDPGTTGESSLRVYFEDGSSVWKTVRYATPVAGFNPLTQPILPPNLMQQLLTVTETTERAYCLYIWKLPAAICNKASLYWKKTGLDSEYKFVQSERDKSHIRVINKQLREFSGENHGTTVVTIPGTCKEISPLFFAQPIPGQTLLNVALHKTANQTATHLKGHAQNAINGDGTTDDYNSALVAYSRGTNTNYWMVDLEKDYTPLSVRIFQTKNGNSVYPSMNNFNVQFLDAKGKVVDSFVSTNKASQPIIEWTNLNNRIKSRYLKINGLATSTPVLAFSELQIWAAPSEVGAGNQFPRSVRPSTPNPCVWEQWSKWSTCTGKCGLAVEHRTRGPDFCRTNDNNVSYEERTCGPTCPVDCLGYWSGWTVCDCLTRKQYSTFNVLQEPLFGGKCEGKSGTLRTQDCAPTDCPVDCVGGWTQWDRCGCGTFSQGRTYAISTPMAYGGLECPHKQGSAEFQPCFPEGCEVPVSPPTEVPDAPADQPTDVPPTDGSGDSKNSEEGGASAGAVAGVAIGCFVAIAVLGVVAVHFLFPKPEGAAFY